MEADPALPVPISYIGSKYLIFDINAVTWLRREHHICGVMGGTLPQSPSQNIFLGLPIQIMPEEAQLLVEKGAAFILDDASAHDRAIFNGDASRQAAYLDRIVKKGLQVSVARVEEKEEARRRKLKVKNTELKPHKASLRVTGEDTTADSRSLPSQNDDEAEVTLFDASTSQKLDLPKHETQLLPHGIVPTTSELWLAPTTNQRPTSESMGLLPNVPSCYALYKHLISRGYFITPGLRFGCQYSVYPGDPLRFHSHFLAIGTEWDQEIDLMDIVGGGRLGTGVKKGFLIGGREPPKSASSRNEDGEEGSVRTFSIEWAAM